VAILALAGSTPAQEQRAPQGARGEVADRPQRKAEAIIFFCTVRDVQCRNDENRFYLNEVRDLFVFVSWPKVSGEHTARVRFLLPDGNVYQQSETRFTTLPEAAAGADSGRKVQVAMTSRGAPTTVLDFPVAGTHITQRSLAGSWTVEVELDGVRVARRELVLLPQRSQ
jgi:hypothetical protein